MAIIYDQTTDKSQSVFIKALRNYKDKEPISSAFNKQASCSEHTKYANKLESLFPVDTKETTIVSKVYFDAQKDHMVKQAVAQVSERLDTYINLYDIPDSIFEKEEVIEKQAEDAISEVYLLPSHGMCKIASSADLEKARELFDTKIHNLPVPERVEFASNYVKVAESLGVHNYSKNIAKYASLLESDFNMLCEQLEVREAAAQRKGESGEEYAKLASMISCCDPEDTSKNSLEKLAKVIYSIDKAHDFDLPKYDKKIPCAYSIVFCKESEEKDDYTNVNDKASIVAKYGTGILEEVENEDGTIDADKLESLTAKLGLKDATKNS